MRIDKIVSGGQTGVDRAALDIALELGVACGGWCPKERWAEDAPIAEKYPLMEASTSDPSERTKLNVRDSDGTLIFIKTATISEGTQLTQEEAERLAKPLLVVNLSESTDAAVIQEWLDSKDIHVLNIAGPRESQSPGIYQDVCLVLRNFLTLTKAVTYSK